MKTGRPITAVRSPARLLAAAAGLGLGLGLGLGAGAALAVPPDYHTIVVAGQVAPGSPEGVVFEFLSSPRVNNAGDVAFWARLGGPLDTDPKVASIWTATLGGALSRAVQGGDQTPFDPAFLFISPFDPALDADGGVTFLASFSDVPNPTHFTPAPAGLFAADGGATADLASRDGAPAPYPTPIADPTFTNILTATTGAPGTVTFYAGVGATPLVGHGIFAADDAGPIAIAARHQEAPGFADGEQFAYLDAPAQGAPGSLLFRATVMAGAAVLDQDQTLWTDRSGPLTLLAKHGDTAPGAPAGSTFADFGTRPVLTGAGDAVFAAEIAGAGVTADNDTGLWTDRSGMLAALAREGEAAPGTGAGVVFASISPRPAVNAAADIAFLAHLRGGDFAATDNSGIWRFTGGGEPMLVVREGDIAFFPNARYAVLHEPSMNGRGQMAFLARLRADEGTGVGPGNNFALLVADPCGGVTPIARTGDDFAFTPPGGEPVTRTIADIVFDTGSPDAGRGQFNDAGTLLYTLRFTDGSSGLFGATAYLRTDFSRDGAVNSGDISAFLTVWLASVQSGSLEGDFNGDGVDNSNDISAFLTAWLAQVGGGC